MKKYSVTPPRGTHHVETKVKVNGNVVRVSVDERGISHHTPAKVIGMCLFAPVPEHTVEMRLTRDESGRLVLIAGVDNFANINPTPEMREEYPEIITYAYVFADTGWAEVQRPDVEHDLEWAEG